MLFKFLLCLLLAVQSRTILVDKVAAVVNDQVIFISDVERAVAFYPFLRSRNESDEAFFRKVLDELVQYQVIMQEYQQEFSLNEDDFEQLQTAILQKVGSMEELRELLKQFEMSWQDFRTFNMPRVLYDKVIREKFPENIIIPFSRIEEYYQKDYVPAQRQFELPVLSLVEMAPVIERYLRLAEKDEKLTEWINGIQASFQVDIRMWRARE